MLQAIRNLKLIDYVLVYFILIKVNTSYIGKYDGHNLKVGSSNVYKKQYIIFLGNNIYHIYIFANKLS